MKFAGNPAGTYAHVGISLDYERRRINIGRRCFDLKVAIIVAYLIIATTSRNIIPDYQLHFRGSFNPNNIPIAYDDDS